MSVNTSVDTSQWDYGQRRPRFESWGDVVNHYYSTFPRQSTWTSNVAQQPSAQGGNQRFWREILAKDEALNRQYERLRSLMPGMTTSNLGRLGQYETSFNQNAPLTSALNASQISAVMSPFTGELRESLGRARQNWAGMSGQQADAAKASLSGLIENWNTGRTGAIGRLRDELGRQLTESTGDLNRQLQGAYAQETALNQQYGTLRDRLAQINQNRAMNQLLASVSPGMGSAMSDFTTRAAMRMSQDAAAQDAALLNQMQRDSLLRRLSGEMGVLDRRTQLQRGDIQDIGRMGMAQQDVYTQQMLNLAAADDARRRQIIDQILGSGALSDIGYVTGMQSQMLGRPQALLNAETQSYLAPIQARQSFMAGELGMVPRAAEALHAANWLSVGTQGNQGGFPVYARPPSVPYPADLIGAYYGSLGNIGYPAGPAEEYYRYAIGNPNPARGLRDDTGSRDLLYSLGLPSSYGRIYS